MKILIIGDSHGKIQKYHEIIKNVKKSICVGDFGFKTQWDWLKKENINPDNHKINMGNHDYLPYLNSPYSLGNWNYWNEIFTIRGANSIDKHLRNEGLDWFSNEELSYSEGNDVIDNYVKIKPKIVVSHDCPVVVVKELFGITDKSITRQILQSCFDEHQPEIWLFGHHHSKKDYIINNTRFICLEELETFEIK